MEKKQSITLRRILIFAAAVFMSVCMLAQPVLAAVSDSDAEAKCKHSYSEWDTIKKPGVFLELGKIERTCDKCGHVQSLPTPSPLLGIVLAVLALIVIVEAVQLLSALAKKAKKGFRILLAILVGVCILILLIGAGAYTLKYGGKFGANLVEGLVQMLGGKGFYASKITDCIFMMFGKVACMIINGLFFVSLLTLIFAVIALVKATISGVRKGAKAVGDSVVEAKDKLFGNDDYND